MGIKSGKDENQTCKVSKDESLHQVLMDAMCAYGFVMDQNLTVYEVIKGKDAKIVNWLEDVIGKNAKDLLTSKLFSLLSNVVDRCFTEKTLQVVEFPLHDTIEIEPYFKATILPFDEDKVLCVICDITNYIKENQLLINSKLEAEEEVQRKTVYFTNMTHEIRTPLNAITGFADLLVVDDDPEMQKQYVEIIKNNSNMLMELINGILDLSRLESGKTDMNFIKVDMDEFINEIYQIHLAMIPKGVKLEVEKPEETVFFNTDRNRLMEVMFNFLSNAIKHTQKGIIKIIMKLTGEKLILVVKDTGSGIPAEKQDLVFERFAKADEAIQGTGLGLPICRAIVHRLGGEIFLDSVVGQGSTFTASFPFNQ